MSYPEIGVYDNHERPRREHITSSSVVAGSMYDIYQDLSKRSRLASHAPPRSRFNPALGAAHQPAKQGSALIREVQPAAASVTIPPRTSISTARSRNSALNISGSVAVSTACSTRSTWDRR